MLTHRTNVLFEHDDYIQLVNLSKNRGVTMGNLIRTAVREKYGFKDSKDYRKQLVKRIQEGRKYLKNPEIPIDYKEWINAGRRF
ncbi:hypothetical protein A2W24_00245 [Microgenomates group bacterium RBG_16_45_19]|nr:MAG: hypothetical protein A2W24_00245 [Microgenomates group bacterium RBG_16_45_19]